MSFYKSNSGLIIAIFVGLLGSIIGLAISMYKVCTQTRPRTSFRLFFCKEKPLRVRNVIRASNAYNNDGYIDVDV